MNRSEKYLARQCANVLARSSEKLSPLAATLESLSDLLRALADDEPVSDDLKTRLEELAPLARRSDDYEELQLALAAAETLTLRALAERGGILEGDGDGTDD